VLCDVDQNALTRRPSGFRRPGRSRPPARLDRPERLRRRRWSPRPSTRTVRTYLALTHGQHVYWRESRSPTTSGKRGSFERRPRSTRSFRRWATRGTRRPPGARSRKSSCRRHRSGARSPVWPTARGDSRMRRPPKSSTSRTGSTTASQIVDPLQGSHARSAENHFDLWLGPAPARPFHETYFPGPRWSAGGRRQWEDERPRQPRQRRAVHGAGHQTAADDRSDVAQWTDRHTRNSRPRR